MVDLVSTSYFFFTLYPQLCGGDSVCVSSLESDDDDGAGRLMRLCVCVSTVSPLCYQYFLRAAKATSLVE